MTTTTSTQERDQWLYELEKDREKYYKLAVVKMEVLIYDH